MCSNIIQKLYKINDNVRSRLDIIYSLVRNDGFFRAYNSPIRLYTTRRSSVNDNENPFDSLLYRSGVSRFFESSSPTSWNFLVLVYEPRSIIKRLIVLNVLSYKLVQMYI